MITLSILLHIINIACWKRHLHNVKYNNVPMNVFEKYPTPVTFGLVTLTCVGVIQIIVVILKYCP